MDGESEMMIMVYIGSSSFVCHSSPLPVIPSPNFVFFPLFVPYLIPNPTKFLFIGEPSGFDSI